MQSIIVVYTKLTNTLFSNYFTLTNIIWSYGYQNHQLFPINDNFLQSGQAKTIFLSDETTFDFSYFLRTREGYMLTITKSGLITARTISFKHA